MLTWHQTRNGLAVTGLGHQALLTLPMTAFFASRQCLGIAIRAAMDWALQQARAKAVVVSEFHSPLERLCEEWQAQGRQVMRLLKLPN